MSGVHLTVEESLKLNLMRYFNYSVLEDITLENPRVPEGVLSGFERIIDVVYHGKRLTVGFDRIDINDIVGNLKAYVAPVDLGNADITLDVLYPYLSSKFGLIVPKEYIDPELFAVDESGQCTIVIASDCHFLKGTVTLRATNKAVSGKYPTPLHEWSLLDNVKNTGTSGVDMTAPFKFVRKPSGKWGTLTGGRTPQVFGNNIKLLVGKDWTFDFEIMFSQIKLYENIFVETIPGGYQNGQFNFYQGRLYEAFVMNSEHGKSCPVDTPVRHTLVCKGGTISYYFNGVMVQTWNTSTSRKFIGGFRNNLTAATEGQCEEDIVFLRNIRYWDQVIEGIDLENLFKDKGNVDIKYPMPDHEWLMRGTGVNSGISKEPISVYFKYVNLPSGTWGTLTGGRTPQLIMASGAELNRAGNWCLDFEMLVKEKPLRNTTFTTNGGEVNGGHIMFYENALYEPYGNSSDIHTFEMPVNVPTRHTLRCIGGTINYYMDGLFAQSWRQDGKVNWRYFRSGFSGTEQMEEDKTFLRNIRFWQNGMSDSEFEELLNDDSYPDLAPVHRWLLDGKTDNTGTHANKPRFAPPVAYSDVNGVQMANLTTIGNHPLGTSFDASGDWTITANVIDPSPGNVVKGFFNTENMLAYGVSTILYTKRLTMYLSTNYANLWNNPDTTTEMKPNVKHSIALVKRGASYRAYIDGVLVQRVSAISAVSGLFTHFGAYNGTASLGTNVKFSDLRLYNYGLSRRQVRQVANGAAVPANDDPYKPPIHLWQLNGNNVNIGTAKGAPFAPPVDYTTYLNRKLASLKTSGIQSLGSSITLPSSYTIIYEILLTTDLSVIGGLLNDSTAQADGVTNIIFKKRVVVRQADVFEGSKTWYDEDDSNLMKPGKYCVCVLTKDSSNNYKSWINGKLVMYANATKPLPTAPITHFGAWGPAGLPTDVRFGNIAIYDYVFSEDQVKRYYRGDYINRL